MEVVLTSNLVFSGTEKTIFNIIMPSEANMNTKQKLCKYEAICSFMIAEMLKSTLRKTKQKNSKFKTNQQ